MKMIPAFYFDPDDLARVAEQNREAFKTASPFQHVVFDDFLPQEVVDLLIGEFPGPDDVEWEVHGPGRTAKAGDRHIDKLATSDETKFGPFTRHFMGQLNSGTFLAFLEDLTGTEGIIADVSYNNCGMHSTGRGGKLMIHTDVNRHPLGVKMHQYLNLLLYLNPDWEEEYGGHLELWSQEKKPVHRILPVANRIVIFDTGTGSFHGHPHPLKCPPERRRNSLALYYYLRDRPSSEEYAGMQRSVHWVSATDDDRAFARDKRNSGVERLEALRGSTVGVGVVSLPFDLPGGLADPESQTVSLYFLRSSDYSDADAFGDAHLRAAIAADGRSAADFLAAHQPIALLGASVDADVMNPRWVTCLLDGDGEMHVVTGPEAPEMVWVGYLDEILDTLGA